MFIAFFSTPSEARFLISNLKKYLHVFFQMRVGLRNFDSKTTGKTIEEFLIYNNFLFFNPSNYRQHILQY